MTELERNIQLRQLINTEGESILEQKRFVNILMDLGYFTYFPSIRNVFNTIVEEEFAHKILLYTHGIEPKDHVFPYLIDSLQTKYCYCTQDVSYALQSILYALGAIEQVESYAKTRDFEWLNKLDSSLEATFDDWNSEYLIINVNPTIAEVYIDYRLYNPINGSLVVELPYGIHNYRVCAPMHHSVVGDITIEEGKQETIDIELKPSYGSINVLTNADDSVVFLDNCEMGKAPIRIDRLGSGIHNIEIKAELYKTFIQQILIKDGEELLVDAKMEPNFGMVHLICPNNKTSIWIDGVIYGKGQWKGKLLVGTHKVECKLESHYSYTEDIVVPFYYGSEIKINLPALNPFYGGLKVNVLPVGCEISIDEEIVGYTPFRTRKILAGSHVVKVTNLESNKSITKNILIEQGKFCEISDYIPGFFAIDLSNIEIGDYLYEDGTYSSELVDTKKCLGTVCSLSPSESDKKSGWTHGYILSLKEDMIDVSWNYVNEAIELLPQPLSHISSPWQIPTLSQWRQIFADVLGLRDNVWNIKFSECHYKINVRKADEFGTYSYWSSTEKSNLRTWCVGYRNKYVTKFEHDKTSSACVRCIAAF